MLFLDIRRGKLVVYQASSHARISLAGAGVLKGPIAVIRIATRQVSFLEVPLVPLVSITTGRKGGINIVRRDPREPNREGACFVSFRFVSFRNFIFLC